MKLQKLLDTYKSLLQKTPKWAQVILGIVAVAIGASIITKPFNSLKIMVILISLAILIDGFNRILKSKTNKLDTQNISGLILVLSGLILLLWPAVTVQIIALVVGVNLLIAGSLDIFEVLQKQVKDRPTHLIRGLAIIIFGVLTLAWQDVAILIIAIAFGIKLIGLGILLIWGIMNKDKADSDETPKRGLITRFASLALAVIMLVSALGLMNISSKLRSSAPVPDDFYSYEGDIPKPGTLLKTESFTKAVPEGVTGWRILYATTRDENNTPAVASAFVMAPRAKDDKPQPLVAWTHGTTGVVPGCAPTVLAEPFPLDGTVPGVKQAFENGWVMVGTDYVGLGTEGPHPYIIGQGEARSALDSIRAVRQMKELKLADETVVWGHSQGGGAALWTGALAKSYAPDITISGVAAAAPASDVPALIEATKTSPIGKIMGTFVLRSYSEIYPDVKWGDYVKPSVDLIAREMSGRCLAEKSTIVSILTSLAIPGSIYSQNPNEGPLGERLKQNIPTGMIDAPLFIAQGETDDLVLPDVQAKYVQSRCDAGQKLEYKTYPGKDHVGVVAKDSPFNDDVASWTAARFAGETFKNTCQ